MSVEMPFVLTEVTVGVELKDSIADLETPVVEYTVPRGIAVAFQAGHKFYLYLADATGAALPDDAIIRVYVADPTGVASKIQVLEAKLGEVNRLKGALEEVYRLHAGFSRAEDEKLIITVLSGTAAAKANTRLRLEGIQIVRIA